MKVQLNMKNYKLKMFIILNLLLNLNLSYLFPQDAYWGYGKIQDSILTAYDSLGVIADSGTAFRSDIGRAMDSIDYHLTEINRLKDSLKNIYSEQQVNSLLAFKLDAEDAYTSGDFDFDFAGKTLDEISAGTANIHLTVPLKNNYDAAYFHSLSTSNPHSVTKAQVGLSNVENMALSNWSGSSNISNLGNITSGTWNAGSITSSGIITSGSDIMMPGNNGVIFFGRGRIEFFGDGQVRIRNNAANGFDRFVFGISTNAYPALKRTNAGLEAYLGDGLANTWFSATTFLIAADTAYSASWNNRKSAASKDAVFDKIESISDAANNVFIRIISANDEPDIPANSTAIWIDTNDASRRYLLNDAGGVQKKVEMQ